MGQISALESAIYSILGSLSVPRNRRKAMLLLFNESERGELLEKCRLGLIELDKKRLKESGEKTGLEPRTTPPLEAVPKEMMVEAYADRYKVSLRRAMLNIAKQLEFITESDCRFLFADLDLEEQKDPPPSEVPEFRKDGTLVYRNEVIARFRPTKSKSRCIKALELLQLNNWAAEVENNVFAKPQSLPDVAHRLRECVNGKISFSGSRAKNTLSWRPM